MSEQTTYIYSLSHPISDEIRYIGKSDNPYKRFIAHLNKSCGIKKTEWINSLKLNGLLPKLQIVDEVPNEEWKFWEQYYICLFRSWGFDLTNISIGGEGQYRGFVPWNKGKENIYSKETIEKIKIKRKNQQTTFLKLSSEKYKEIYKSYKSGNSIKNIALFYGVSSTTISYVLQKFGRIRPSQRRINSEIEKKVLFSFLNSKEKIIDISRKINIGCNEITKILKKNGINAKKYRNRLDISQDTRKKLSESGKMSNNTGRFLRNNPSYNATPIIQLSLKDEPIKEWRSCNLAKTTLKIHNIFRVLKGKSKSAGGYKWKFKN